MNTEFFIAKRIIKGRKGRRRISRPTAIIAITGVAVGIAVMIITISVVKGFQRSIRDKVEGFYADIQITNLDLNTSFEQTPVERNQPFIATLQKLPNVKHLQVFATKNGIIKTKTENEGVTLNGVGNDYDWSFIKRNMVKGDVFVPHDSTPSTDIVISDDIASELGADLGSKLFIFFVTKTKTADTLNPAAGVEQRVKTFYVKGIYHTGFEDYDKQMVFTDIAQVQSLNFWSPSQVGGFQVLCKDFNQLDSTLEAVKGAIGINLNAQSVRQAKEPIFNWLDLQDVNAKIIIGLMSLVSAIAMVSALIVLILENTNLIGLLKALGSPDFNIQQIFLIDGAYLIFRGLLIGNIIGIAICLVQQQYKLIPLPQDTYYMPYVPIYINWWWIILLNLGSFLVTLLMLLLPSLIVSRITPVKTLRYS